MRHNFESLELTESDKTNKYLKGKAKCKTCGLIKWINKYPPNQYSRGMIIFPIGNPMPDCFDMEVENQKTID